MSAAKIVELQQDIAELKQLLNQSTRKKVREFLELQIRKLETEYSTENQKIEKQQDRPAATSSTSIQDKRYQIKLNGYGWGQSDKYVKVFVTLKDVHTLPKDKLFCKLTEKSMELHIENLQNKDYLLVINNLLEPINVEESHWKQKTDMVAIFLAKTRPVQWSHMTEIEKKFDDQKNNRFKTEDMEKKDPQESIMGLMKNMYETGDDEMKRMISKAWYEGQHKQKTDTMDL